jgi:uncharacterized membrane protein YfcA
MWLEFMAIGLVAGYLAGFLGIGGGFVVVPALTYLFLRDAGLSAMAIHYAVATSLATMLVTSLSSIWAHQKRGAVQWAAVRALAPGLVIGAVLGAAIADQLPGEVLTQVFGGFALLAGLQLVLAKQPEAHRDLPGPVITGLIATLFGAISSLVGIGGGSLTAPWLMWHRVRAQLAVATASACGYPIAVAGTLSYVLLGRMGGADASFSGYVHLPAFVGIALTSALAAPLGVATVHKLPPLVVRRFFGVFLLLVGIRMLLNA